MKKSRAVFRPVYCKKGVFAMLDEIELMLYKRRLLVLLDERAGLEVREKQLLTDYQMRHDINAKAADVRQALNALMDQAHATRRLAEFDGWVWKVTPTGHAAAAKLALED